MDNFKTMKLLSPKQIYTYLKEVNQAFACPLCEEREKSQEERDFIDAIGHCYSCEKIRSLVL